MIKMNTHHEEGKAVAPSDPPIDQEKDLKSG
jgi:hypothetical protein